MEPLLKSRAPQSELRLDRQPPEAKQTEWCSVSDLLGGRQGYMLDLQEARILFRGAYFSQGCKRERTCNTKIFCEAETG